MEPSQLPQDIRRIVVEEIKRWLKEGIIPNSMAETLQKRYDFDFRPPAPAIVAPTAKPVQPAPPPKPHLTLAQALLSETSIRIALYLGAFFVISASMILAALVAGLRLPILVTVTILFAVGAVVLKRRLPQPSFILHLVFSALLPITASVLAGLLDFAGKTATGYWVAVLSAMALIWVFSTWLYHSRFFSLTALLALDSAMIMTGILLNEAPAILFLLLLTFSSLAGLGGTYLINRWQGKRMALPVFILAQVQQGLILATTIIILLSEIISNNHEWGLFFASTLLLTGCFAVLSNILFPNILFPWIAVGVLMPVAWLVVVRSHSGGSISPLTLGIWGILFVIVGDIIHRTREKLRAYVLPLSLAAIPLLLLGAASGLIREIWLGFSLFLGTAVVLSFLHAFRNRVWLWAIALGFGLVAYFAFFHLPFAKPISGHWCSQLAGATLFLLLPDLVLPSGKVHSAWRWPLHAWAMLIGFLTLSSGILSSFFGTPAEVIIAPFVLGIMGIIYLIHAVRLHRPNLAVLFSIHITLALVFGLRDYQFDPRLPILTGLAVAFFICGYILQQKNLPDWSRIFRWSGLVIAGILPLMFFGYTGSERALYVAILASLFLFETFHLPWLETVAPAVYSLSLVMLLAVVRVESAAYYTAGIAWIFLTFDLFYTRLKKRRDIKWATRVLGGLFAVITPFSVILQGNKPLVGLLVCASLALLFVIQALLYHQLRLGYAATVFFTLAILFMDLNYFAGYWLWCFLITSLVFFGLSILLRRLRQPEWASILLNSGLGLASLTALSAPFEHSGLIASLPVAIAASLWAVEAFRRRNVWLGFPANGLYLIAYFMILSTLKVNQAQFYTVGAAILGLLMHYLLVRIGSKTGAFLIGMVSQLVLLSTTYIQMVGTENVLYFAVLFFQCLVVLIYGIVIRSRSLVIAPIVMVVIGVSTVVFSILRDISIVFLIGCTGIGLILVGIAALLLRERIGTLRDRIKDWRA